MTPDSTAFQINPGDIANWPMLKIQYRTDPDKLAALLPPGIEPGARPDVHLTVYNFPVLGEPEYGVTLKVAADYGGMPGRYAIGYGIDQESAIFISQETNGQPKYPCSIRYFRCGEKVEASCTHQGYTFLEYRGEVAGVDPNPPDEVENEWWIKVSRAVGGLPKSYDFPPHVVQVHSVSGTARQERLDGTLVLGDSPWDPIAERLPICDTPSARLWWPVHKTREISLQGKLDPDAFWPFADTISGSRWPGDHGGPVREA